MDEEEEEDSSGSPALPPDAAGSHAEQLTLYDILPFAPEDDPEPKRRRWSLPVIGGALAAVIALAAVVSVGSIRPLAGKTSTTTQPAPATDPNALPTTSPSTSPATSPTTSLSTAAAPTTTVPDGVQLAGIGVRPGDLGNVWSDLGLEPFARVAQTPPTCASYDGAFSKAMLHQYAYKSPGTGQGVLTSMIVDTASTLTVSAINNALRSATFATCAGAMAELELSHDVVDQPVVNSMHAQPLGLVTAPNVIGWRVLVNFASTAGGGTFGMDIFSATSGTLVARVAVSHCFCATPPAGILSPLLPDEVLAVNAVAHRMGASEAAAALPVVAPSAGGGGNSPGACLLLDATQLRAVLASTDPGVGSTLSDGANQCVWQQVSAGVVIQSGDTLAQYETRLKTAIQPVSGIGDRADLDPGVPGKVLALKGQIWIQVFVAGTPADRTNALSLAQSVLAEL